MILQTTIETNTTLYESTHITLSVATLTKTQQQTSASTTTTTTTTTTLLRSVAILAQAILAQAPPGSLDRSKKPESYASTLSQAEPFQRTGWRLSINRYYSLSGLVRVWHVCGRGVVLNRCLLCALPSVRPAAPAKSCNPPRSGQWLLGRPTLRAVA